MASFSRPCGSSCSSAGNAAVRTAEVDAWQTSWEWTNTCFIRQSLDAVGKPAGASIANCEVRVVEGEHRTYVTDFIRDARVGGCAVGKPPSNFGFRLVREE